MYIVGQVKKILRRSPQKEVPGELFFSIKLYRYLKNLRICQYVKFRVLLKSYGKQKILKLKIDILPSEFKGKKKNFDKQHKTYHEPALKFSKNYRTTSLVVYENLLHIQTYLQHTTLQDMIVFVWAFLQLWLGQFIYQYSLATEIYFLSLLIFFFFPVWNYIISIFL